MFNALVVLKKNPVTGFSIDSRTINQGEGYIALKGIHCDGHDFVKEAIAKGAKLVIVEKDLDFISPVKVVKVPNTYQALSEIVRFYRKEKKTYLSAVTGSVGKTTTKEMIHFLFSQYTTVLKNQKTENNFLGVSKTLLSLKKEKVVILELGTNAPGEIKTLGLLSVPEVGVFTFIKPVHLQGLKNLQGVFKEKVSLREVNPKMKLVINSDDRFLKTLTQDKNVFTIGVNNKKSDLFANLLEQDKAKSVFLVDNKYRLQLNTPFPGFIYNALLALANVYLWGIEIKDLVEKLNGFSAFPDGRMQIKRYGNLSVLNDAYNANPYSFSQALKTLKAFSQPKVAFIGDMLELGSKSAYFHRRLADSVLTANFEFVITLGKKCLYLQKKLRDLGYNNVFHVAQHKEAAELIQTRCKDKEYLLFLKGSRSMMLEKVLDYLVV